MVSWPTFDRRRAISSSRSSAGRLFMAAVLPPRKLSRQPERVAAVTPSSRESVSRSSPRRSRRTASVFRLAEKRPRSWLSVLVLLLGISGTPSRDHYGPEGCPEKTSGYGVVACARRSQKGKAVVPATDDAGGEAA